MVNQREQVTSLEEQLAHIIDEHSKRNLPPEDAVLIDVYKETIESIDKSESPKLYIFGRAGAGKSSLINALAEKEIAEVGDIEPETAQSNKHEIDFEGLAAWEVIDSRGLFEATPADGGESVDTVDLLREDIREYKPDILLHVMTPDQIRAGKQDFRLVEDLRSELNEVFPPIIYCINKIDGLSGPFEWPPEEYPEFIEKIQEEEDFLSKQILDQGETIPIHNENPHQGYMYTSNTYVGAIPTMLQQKENYWNIEVLKRIIGEELPKSKQLQFHQSQQHTYLLRRIAERTTTKYADLASKLGGVSTVPPPEELHLKLIGLIAAFSGQEASNKTVKKYLRDIKSNIPQEETKLTAEHKEILKDMESQHAEVASKATIAIGQSAQQYFFDDLKEKPANIIDRV